MTSVETTLSPRLVVSNLSPTLKLNTLSSLVSCCSYCLFSNINKSISDSCSCSNRNTTTTLETTSAASSIDNTTSVLCLKTLGPLLTLLPVQVVSHDPQSIGDNPVLLSAPVCCMNELKLPSISYVAEDLLVSIQVSVDGLSSIFPIQFTTANGFTFSILVANLFSRKTVSS